MKASEIVTDVLDKLSNPLIQQIDLYIHSNPKDPEYLLKAFKHPVTWMTMEPYTDMRFEWEFAEFSITQLCNLVELLHGNSLSYQFADELTKQIKEMVEGRIQLFLDQQRDDEQRKLNHEHEGVAV
jgi:hypothetical protein